MSDALDQIITANDLLRGGACYEGVMASATEEWPAAFTIKAAIVEAKSRDHLNLVRRALALDGNGDGYGDGYGYGDGDGYGYGDGDGDGYGYGYGYGDGYGDGGYRG